MSEQNLAVLVAVLDHCSSFVIYEHVDFYVLDIDSCSKIVFL